MASKRQLSIFFLLCLASASFAGTITESFTYAPNQWVRYISTDIKADPSFSPGSLVYCVGSQINPASISSAWYVNTYDTLLSNAATQESCPIPYTTVNTNQPITWVSASQYTGMTTTNPYFPSPTSFQTYMGGINVPSTLSDEKSRLMNANGGVMDINGNTYFQAASRIYCKSTASVSSSNPAYNQAAVPYLGQSPVFSNPIVLNQAGAFTFNTIVSLDGCLAAAATYLNSPCASTVYFYKNLSASPTTFTSPATTITVKNPFLCSAVQFSNPQLTPATVPPGQPLSFSFIVINPSTNGEPAKITAVNASWAYSQPIVTSGLPTVSIGGSAPVYGTLAAPSTPGTYNFNLIVNYSSATADCSGATKICSTSFPFTVVVSPSSLPDYVPILEVLPTTPIYVGQSFSLTPKTKNNGTAGTTISSTTRLARNNGWVSDCSVTGLAAGATAVCSSSSFTCTSEGSMLFNETVDFLGQIGEQNESNNVVNLTVHCIQPANQPNYISTISAPSSAVYGSSFNVTVNTSNIGLASGANASQMQLLASNGGSWLFNVPSLPVGGSRLDNVSVACNQASITLGSSADIYGNVSESNELDNNDTFTVQCIPPANQPDYVSSITAPIEALTGIPFSISVTTTNIGTASATVSSITNLSISNQPSVVNFNVPALAIGASVTNITTASCPWTPGDVTLQSYADAGFAISEQGENNNINTTTVHCVPFLSMPNYVPNVSAPPVAFMGVPFAANFTTKNIGLAPAAAISTTHAAFQSVVHDFSIAPLANGSRQDDAWLFTCSSPGTSNITERVDFQDSINESIEGDNFQEQPIICSPVPDRCTLSFVNHNSTIKPSELVVVLANCTSKGQVAACPPFYWNQTANETELNPVYTGASFYPNSTLFVHNNAPQQLGMKVNVASTLLAIPLHCELGFDISERPVGPDYTVTSIIPDNSTAGLGQVVHFNVSVKNIGNVNATNDSTSEAAFSSGCTPIGLLQYDLPHLDVNETDINSDLACTCEVAGLQNITVNANPTHVQWETDYDNNARTQTFICQGPAQPVTCSYFV
ncbi:MAG: CARDB domain-containing protein [Candidatus Micrarchaeia archaeon]